MKKIKELTHKFGIPVVRAIWPKKGERNVQKLGVAILGLCALLGAAQASSVRKLFAGSAYVAAGTTPKPAVQSTVAAPATTTPTAADTMTADLAPTAGAPNIVDIMSESELIVRGTIKEVNDGIDDKGIPYTQVTLQVSEALRGQFGDEYTFRQFGLTKPRRMDNGRVNLNVTPAGWAKYNSGEDVVLFLHPQASLTGLRTTIGLGQGKLAISGGNITSQFDNDGLFANVDVNGNLLNDRDKRLLATKKGPVNAESFMSFVRRAVKDKWIEGGKLRNAKK